jgi:hypothetical protein
MFEQLRPLTVRLFFFCSLRLANTSRYSAELPLSVNKLYFRPSNAATNNTILGGYPGLFSKAQLMAASGPVAGNPNGSVALICKPREANSRFLRIWSLFLNSQAL